MKWFNAYSCFVLWLTRHSRVYLGEYRREVVGVKMLYAIELDAPIIKQFCDEARLLNDLSHPNIVECRGVCVMPPAVCLIQEWCEHGSLYSFLRPFRARPSSLPLACRAQLILDCVRGVVHLHSRGLVHRDLKSLNFLVTKDLRVKLADMGEVRRQGQRAEEGVVKPTTRNWSPPEVLCARAREFRTSMDVYSLALVIYVSTIPSPSQCSTL